MDAFGLGGYGSSSDSEEEEQPPQGEIVSHATTDGKPSSAFSVVKRTVQFEPKPSPPPPPPPPPSVPTIARKTTLLADYASSDDSEAEGEILSSIPPSQVSLNLKPPAPPPPPGPKSPVISGLRIPSPNLTPLQPPKKRRKIDFPSSPPSRPDPALQQQVKRWKKQIDAKEISNLSEMIKHQKEFMNPYLLTQASEEFKIDEYSTNFENFRETLIHAQKEKNSYLTLRQRQILQIQRHEKRKQQKGKERAAKRQKPGESRFLPQQFIRLPRNNSLAGMNMPSQLLRQISSGLGR